MLFKHFGMNEERECNLQRFSCEVADEPADNICPYNISCRVQVQDFHSVSPSSCSSLNQVGIRNQVM